MRSHRLDDSNISHWNSERPPQTALWLGLTAAGVALKPILPFSFNATQDASVWWKKHKLLHTQCPPSPFPFEGKNGIIFGQTFPFNFDHIFIFNWNFPIFFGIISINIWMKNKYEPFNRLFVHLLSHSVLPAFHSVQKSIWYIIQSKSWKVYEWNWQSAVE